MSDATVAAGAAKPPQRQMRAKSEAERAWAAHERKLIEEQIQALPPCDPKWDAIHAKIGSMVTKMRDRAQAALQNEVRGALRKADREQSLEPLPADEAPSEARQASRKDWGWKQMTRAAEEGCVGFVWFDTEFASLWASKSEWLENVVRTVLPDATFQLIPDRGGSTNKAQIAVLLAVPRDSTQRLLMMSSIESGIGVWVWDPETQEARSVPPVSVL